MNDEERQKLLAEMARRPSGQESANQGAARSNGGARLRAARGCLFFAVAVPAVLVFVHFFVTPLVQPIGAPDAGTERALAEIRRGPIPREFQGAYNTVECGSRYMDGLVTIGGKSVTFPSATFTADEVVAKSERSVTLRGSPAGVGFQEAPRNFTITLSEDGNSAQIDGVTADRCSRY